jgi:hypothetical protein
VHRPTTLYLQQYVKSHEIHPKKIISQTSSVGPSAAWIQISTKTSQFSQKPKKTRFTKNRSVTIQNFQILRNFEKKKRKPEKPSDKPEKPVGLPFFIQNLILN